MEQHIIYLLLISYTEYKTDRNRNSATKQERKTVRESHIVISHYWRYLLDT